MKIIAECAFNHNGSFEELKMLALKSKESGADYITVQVMNVDSFCVTEYEKYQLYKDTEFSENEWINFFNFCIENKIEVIPCVLEEESFKLCYNYGFKKIKIHATDITNKPFLSKISNKVDVKVILETQCASMFETEFAIKILGREKIDAIFSGYSNYPTEIEDFNLNVLDTFKEKFDLPVGYADHSLDTTNLPLMVLSKGCKYLEKHITISRNNRHLDYQVSLYPNEFAIMVNVIKHYSLALGNSIKHPILNEHKYRNIMYKKVIAQKTKLKRANHGVYFIDNEIDSFDKENIVVALVARLKSRRLKQKVLIPFHENELIVDLYNRLSTSKKFKTILATSEHSDDNPLYNLFLKNNFNCYRGDPISVIDRMLSLAYEEKASAIFRVTGDNPFTDPSLMEQMIELLNNNKLDYVKVNNLPFGVGAELFSTKYLWKLYLNLETTLFSEYLTWYVLKDENVKIGCIDIELKNNNNYLVNLSVDLQEDYDRCKLLLNKMKDKKFTEITLYDILSRINDLPKVDDNKKIKLPGGETIKLKDYIQDFNNKNYTIRKKLIVK